MVLSGFENLMLSLFLMINPDLTVWVGLFFLIFVIALALSRSPGTVSVHFLFILVFVLASSYGGPAESVKILMIAALGISLVAAVLKLGNR